MNRTSVLGILLANCLMSGSVLAADWPRFLGPNADGISPDTGINKDWKASTPPVLWKINLSDDGFAGPCVAAGLVFIVDHKGKEDIVRALELKTGKEAWSFAYDDADRSNYGFARATPAFDAGKLYTMSRSGKLNCLDAKTGKGLWQKDIMAEFGGQKPAWDMAISPLIDGAQVIVCPGGSDAAVVALDKNSGNLVWKGAGSDKPGYATPVLATLGGQKQYVVFTAFAVMGVDPKTGKRLWSYPWKTGYDVNAPTPIVQGNAVFITSGYKTGCALLKIAGDKAEPVWTNKAMQSHFSTPVLYKDFIYGTTDPGDLLCLDPKTGKEAWRQGGFEKGGVVAVDGVLLALTGKQGELVMVELNPKEYKELGRFKPLGGQSWTAPIVADGKLIIRNKQTLACLELKPSAK